MTNPFLKRAPVVDLLLLKKHQTILIYSLMLLKIPHFSYNISFSECVLILGDFDHDLSPDAEPADDQKLTPVPLVDLVEKNIIIIIRPEGDLIRLEFCRYLRTH